MALEIKKMVRAATYRWEVAWAIFAFMRKPRGKSA